MPTTNLKGIRIKRGDQVVTIDLRFLEAIADGFDLQVEGPAVYDTTMVGDLVRRFSPWGSPRTILTARFSGDVSGIWDERELEAQLPQIEAA